MCRCSLRVCVLRLNQPPPLSLHTHSLPLTCHFLLRLFLALLFEFSQRRCALSCPPLSLFGLSSTCSLRTKHSQMPSQTDWDSPPSSLFDSEAYMPLAGNLITHVGVSLRPFFCRPSRGFALLPLFSLPPSRLGTRLCAGVRFSFFPSSFLRMLFGNGWWWWWW